MKFALKYRDLTQIFIYKEKFVILANLKTNMYKMKLYNFDEIIERRGTSCVKYDGLQENFGNKDLIPLWVADMDFATPDFIIDALKKKMRASDIRIYIGK